VKLVKLTKCKVSALSTLEPFFSYFTLSLFTVISITCEVLSCRDFCLWVPWDASEENAGGSLRWEWESLHYNLRGAGD